MAEDLQRFQNPKFARFYLKPSAAADERGGAEHRHKLLAGLSGQVVEVGAGQGRNFAYYPSEVREVVAVEPEALLRAEAEKSATAAPLLVTVTAGHADALPVDDASAAVWSSPWCCARCPIRPAPWARPRGSRSRAGSCASTSTCARAAGSGGCCKTPSPRSGRAKERAATPTGTPPPRSAPPDSRSPPWTTSRSPSPATFRHSAIPPFRHLIGHATR